MHTYYHCALDGTLLDVLQMHYLHLCYLLPQGVVGFDNKQNHLTPPNSSLLLRHKVYISHCKQHHFGGGEGHPYYHLSGKGHILLVYIASQTPAR